MDASALENVLFRSVVCVSLSPVPWVDCGVLLWNFLYC